MKKLQAWWLALQDAYYEWRGQRIINRIAAIETGISTGRICR